MRKISLLLFISIHSLFSTVVVEDENRVSILTPCLQQRKTLKLRLDNGLEAYLISDPNVDKSGAALSVSVGSWSDPQEYPGLAHFTEHMLFLGTKKYPKEAQYQQFISQHGGMSNAFTTYDSTNYLFSVDNRYFDEALDRFSDFFKEPLFNPSGVSRELQAVDQEYAKNLQSDFIRQHSVQKDLANRMHPFHQFSMGNSTTLTSVSQDVLKNFYANHYSANLMHLIIISPLPLDQLKEMTIKDFQDIPNANKASQKFTYRATSKEYDQHMVFIEPVREMRNLAFIWEIPQKYVQMKDSKPDHIICYILGHEGKKSLLAELKREGLAESLACGMLRLGGSQALFYIDIDLTENGLKQKDTVIERTFQTINALKSKDIPEYIFKDAQNIEKLRYQYQPCEDVFAYLMKMISLTQEEKLETFPIQTYITHKFDPKAIKGLLNELTPQNVQLHLLTPLKTIGITADKTEKWTQTAYAVKPILTAKIASWSKTLPHANIDLPPPNPYVPESFTLYPNEAEYETRKTPIPEKLIDDENAKIYFAQDTHFNVPKIFYAFEIRTPMITMEDSSSIVMADLYIKMLTESLNSLGYEASLADLKFAIKRTANGITISLNGYHDKAKVLFDEILKQLKPRAIEEDKFKIYKDSLQKQYQNFAKESPLSQGLEVLKDSLNKIYVTEKEKGIAIKKVNYQKFNTYLSNLLDQAYIEGVLYGNLTEPQGIEISQSLIHTINASPYPKPQMPEVLILPQTKGPFLIEKDTKALGNALILAIEGNSFTFKERAAQQIAMHAISHPFYHTLRTKQQTGYIVQSSDKEVEKQLFDLFLIQSSTHEVQDLLSRFEQFIESHMQEFEHEFKAADFETIKIALLQELKTPPKNMREMGELLATLAFKYDGDFDWNAKRIQAMEALNYPEFLELTKQFLGKQNKKRLAIMIKGTIPKENSFKFIKLKGIAELKQIGSYQSFSGM